MDSTEMDARVAAKRWVTSLGGPLVLASFLMVAAPAAAQDDPDTAGPDPVCVGDPGLTQSVASARRGIRDARETLRTRRADLAAILNMNETELQHELVLVRSEIAIDREALRHDYGSAAEKQQRLKEHEAKLDLITEALTRALIGDRVNPERNPYTVQVRAAVDELQFWRTTYGAQVRACVNRSRDRLPDAPPPSRQVAAAQPVPPETPPPRTGGRIKFKPMSESDSRAMAAAVAPQGGSSSPPFDEAAWSGRYTDRVMVYNLTLRNQVLVIVGSKPGEGFSLNGLNCREEGDALACDGDGYSSDTDRRIEFAGALGARKVGGAISIAITFKGLNVQGPLQPADGAYRAGATLSLHLDPY